MPYPLIAMSVAILKADPCIYSFTESYPGIVEAGITNM